jgi:hypothetical protein
MHLKEDDIEKAVYILEEIWFDLRSRTGPIGEYFKQMDLVSIQKIKSEWLNIILKHIEGI